MPRNTYCVIRESLQGLGINLTAVFLVLSHNGASCGSSIFPATVCINLLEFGTGLMDRSSVDCPLIENAIRILIFSTVMPWRWHLGLSWLSAPMERQLAATTLLRHCMESDLAMAASPNLGTATAGRDLSSFHPNSSGGGWRSTQHSPTHSIEHQTHQLTSQLGNHAGIVDPQAVVDGPPPAAHGVPSAQAPHA